MQSGVNCGQGVYVCECRNQETSVWGRIMHCSMTSLLTDSLLQVTRIFFCSYFVNWEPSPHGDKHTKTVMQEMNQPAVLFKCVAQGRCRAGSAVSQCQKSQQMSTRQVCLIKCCYELRENALTNRDWSNAYLSYFWHLYSLYEQDTLHSSVCFENDCLSLWKWNKVYWISLAECSTKTWNVVQHSSQRTF